MVLEFFVRDRLFDLKVLLSSVAKERKVNQTVPFFLKVYMIVR